MSAPPAKPLLPPPATAHAASHAAAPASLQERLDALPPRGAPRAPAIVDLVLAEAVRQGASDAHFEPTPAGLELRFRLDGVLLPVARLDRDLAPYLVARLKVLAELLTYRTDVPQEGAVRDGPARLGAEMRVSTFPTVHGEKAVVRLFGAAPVRDLADLGLPDAAHRELAALLRERSGAVLLTGPSGSGKTTTIYACLRELARPGGRHIVTIEDPVEQLLGGVTQSQARPGTDFDFARGLRSLLRQDPEIIMIGEVRDRDTAAIAVEAALTGHLVFSTLHAGSACGVLGRLLDMGIEPYLLTSSVKGILNQRLVRRACPTCAAAGCAGSAALCAACAGAGYRGRLLLAEMLTLDGPLRQAVLARSDTAALERAADRPGRFSLWTAAADAVARGDTTAAEIDRVLGPRPTLACSPPAGEGPP